MNNDIMIYNDIIMDGLNLFFFPPMVVSSSALISLLLAL